jgi:hypothetical protein
MLRKILCIKMFIINSCLSLAFQQAEPVHNFSPKSDFELQGRIVLYDWDLHESTLSDDFVFMISDNPSYDFAYVRVIYRPFWGFDAPKATDRDGLDRMAFIGRGPRWRLSLYVPQNDEERSACNTVGLNPKYQDETGSGEILRYIPTPGATTAETGKIPPLASLPCFILNHKGLTRVIEDTKPKGGNRGQSP